VTFCFCAPFKYSNSLAQCTGTGTRTVQLILLTGDWSNAGIVQHRFSLNFQRSVMPSHCTSSKWVRTWVTCSIGSWQITPVHKVVRHRAAGHRSRVIGRASVIITSTFIGTGLWLMFPRHRHSSSLTSFSMPFRCINFRSVICLFPVHSSFRCFPVMKQWIFAGIMSLLFQLLLHSNYLTLCLCFFLTLKKS